jgi:hypothetical protein
MLAKTKIKIKKIKKKKKKKKKKKQLNLSSPVINKLSNTTLLMFGSNLMLPQPLSSMSNNINLARNVLFLQSLRQFFEELMQ